MAPTSRTPASRTPAAGTAEDRRSTTRTARLRSRIPEPDEEPDLLGQYLTQIGATPLLTAEDEVRLATRIEAGVRAREELETADTGEPAPAPGRRRALEETVRDGQEGHRPRRPRPRTRRGRRPPPGRRSGPRAGRAGAAG